MYQNLADTFEYAPRWERETLEFRTGQLNRDLPRVAWVYEKPDTSTFRYRVYNMVEGLREEFPQTIAASWFKVEEIPALISRVPQLDALVLTRVRYNLNVSRLIATARAHRVPVIFDCDDLVFDTRFVHLILDTLDQNTAPERAWDFWFACCGRLEATARLCDAGITTNDFLAERMKEVVHGPVHVVPNFLNRDQQEVSEALLAEKRSRRFASEGPVGIGYFSGTPTHSRDFAIAAPAIARLFERDPDVRLRVVGFFDDAGPMEKFSNRVEVIPLQDWMNLQRKIAEVEINIAPLQDNIFTNCKSELKFFEAACVGTWTLASPTFTFRNAITSSWIGQLPLAQEWDAALGEAVALARSIEMFAARAEANAEYVREKYGWNQFQHRIRKAVTITI